MPRVKDAGRPRAIRGIDTAHVTEARKAVGGESDSETIRLALGFAAAVGPRALEAQHAFAAPTPARAVQVALDLALARTEGATTPEGALRLILRLAQVALGEHEPARSEPPPPAALQAPVRIEEAADDREVWASAIHLRGLGVPLRFVGRYLASRGVTPPRGGEWHNGQVKLGLIKAGYNWDANEKAGDE